MRRGRRLLAPLLIVSALLTGAVRATAEAQVEAHQAALPTGARSPWVGRLSLALDGGLSVHTLDHGTGPFFFADFAVGYGVVEGLSVELLYTFTFLRTEHPTLDLWAVAAQVHAVMPGVRYRFLDGDLVPYVAGHVGASVNRDARYEGDVDRSLMSAGFVADVRAGLEWFVDPIFAIAAFASYNLATDVPAATSRRDPPRDLTVAHYFFVGLGATVVLEPLH